MLARLVKALIQTKQQEFSQKAFVELQKVNQLEPQTHSSLVRSFVHHQKHH